MRAMLVALVAGCSAAIPARAQEVVHAGVATMAADSSFRAFLASFEAGLLGMFNGDTTLWFANASHADDVTLFTPYGPLVRGWAQVAPRYRYAASRMDTGTTLQMEYVTIDASRDLAYVVVLERSDFHWREDQVQRQGVTRATNVFRREAGQWKLVHRHMDHLPLDAPPPK